jgi:hypothetical protein
MMRRPPNGQRERNRTDAEGTSVVAAVRPILGLAVGCCIVGAAALALFGIADVDHHHPTSILLGGLAGLFFGGLGGYLYIAISGPWASRSALVTAAVLTAGMVISVGVGAFETGSWFPFFGLALLAAAAWLGGAGRRRELESRGPLHPDRP